MFIYSESPLVLFWITGAGLFSPIFFFKDIFIKFGLLAFAYPVWLVSGYAYGLPVSGIIQNIGDEQYSNLYPEAFFTSVLTYVAFIIPIWSIRNSSFNLEAIRLSSWARWCVVILFSISVSLAYPSVFNSSAERFGSGGSLVVFFMSLIIITASGGKFDKPLIVLLLILLYIVLRGERVDFILGAIAAFVFLMKKNNFSLINFAALSLLALLLAVISGSLRAGGDFDILSIIQLLPIFLISFGTAVDSIHVFMSAIWHVNEIGYTYRPFINLVSSYFPLFGGGGASSEDNYAWLLRGYIDNLGGGLFYIVGLMGAGIFGSIGIGFAYGFLFRKLFLAIGLSRLFFVCFFIMQFRLQWYGLSYFGNVVILVLYFIVILKLNNYARQRLV
jgi:hypothetical protein